MEPLSFGPGRYKVILVPSFGRIQRLSASKLSLKEFVDETTKNTVA
jgi:hypothetical protein